jgi:hypothetical protein
MENREEKEEERDMENREEKRTTNRIMTFLFPSGNHSNPVLFLTAELVMAAAVAAVSL